MSLTRMDTRLMTYQQIYERFWKDIVEIAPYGVLNKDQVMRELSDYSLILEQVSRVYYHITNGRISKQNTLAEAVIAVYEDIMQEAIDEALKEERELIRDHCTCGALDRCE